VSKSGLDGALDVSTIRRKHCVREYAIALVRQQASKPVKYAPPAASKNPVRWVNLRARDVGHLRQLPAWVTLSRRPLLGMVPAVTCQGMPARAWQRRPSNCVHAAFTRIPQADPAANVHRFNGPAGTTTEVAS
jgi:hypothetical protein